MQQIAPLLTCHYFTDDFFSWRGLQAGWQCRLRSGYAFTHWWAQHMRGAGMTEHQRMCLDQQYFLQAQSLVLSGQWRHPWPPDGGRR
jgi:hypothetical protein